MTPMICFITKHKIMFVLYYLIDQVISWNSKLKSILFLLKVIKSFMSHENFHILYNYVASFK